MFVDNHSRLTFFRSILIRHPFSPSTRYFFYRFYDVVVTDEKSLPLAFYSSYPFFLFSTFFTRDYIHLVYLLFRFLSLSWQIPRAEFIHSGISERFLESSEKTEYRALVNFRARYRDFNINLDQKFQFGIKRRHSIYKVQKLLVRVR